MSILAELKRRKMFQVIAAYAVVAWLVVEVTTGIEEPLHLPAWTDTLVIVLLALGFPVMLVVSWAFNVTREGLVRDTGADSSGPSGRTIEFVLIGLVGIAVVWLIYRTEFDSPPESEPLVVEHTAPDVLSNSIAVLPLENLSSDPDNAFFAAGIHDSILNELAKIRDMHVIARTTMLRYAGAEKTFAQIAGELRVQAIMEGSVQIVGGRVRVITQLIDPQTEAHLWSETYDNDFENIFEIQTDIAKKIAAAMQAELSPDEEAQLAKQMTSSSDAYAFYIEAMALTEWDISPGTSTPEFHHLLDQAIALDPDFARAIATRAFAHSYHADEEDSATKLAARAIELDSELGLGYAAIANIEASNIRFESAYKAFEKAYNHSPNDRDVVDNLTRFRAATSDSTGAIELARRLKEVDPGNYLLARLTWASGDLAGARDIVERDASLFPEVGRHHLDLAFLEYMLGNAAASDRAVRLAMRLLTPETQPRNQMAIVAHRYRLMGFEAEAGRWYEAFQDVDGRLGNRRPFSADLSGSNEAEIMVNGALATADYETALELLQLIAARRDEGRLPNPNALRYSVLNMHGDPRLDKPDFMAVRRQLGYVPGSRDWCIFPSCDRPD